MADLNVQPKKKSSWLPWLLLALGIIALIFFLSKGCNNHKNDAVTTDTTASVSSTTTDSATTSGTHGWEMVDFNAPAVAYDEITLKDIDVRGNSNYGIYGLGQNILFDEGKSTLRPQAEQNLKQIAASIDKRYKGGAVRVYGFTDSVGTPGYNKELADQRATTVRNWLVTNAGISQDKIYVNAVGESDPVATNATAQGRQQNRRVEIVAKAS